jgi:hypothetical protein
MDPSAGVAGVWHCGTCVVAALTKLWVILHLPCLQVLLTMSRQHKHEQTVLQLLKKRVMQACEEDAAGGSSSSSVGGGCSGWMCGLQQVNKCPTLKDMQEGLLKATR